MTRTVATARSSCSLRTLSVTVITTWKHALPHHRPVLGELLPESSVEAHSLFIISAPKRFEILSWVHATGVDGNALREFCISQWQQALCVCDACPGKQLCAKLADGEQDGAFLLGCLVPDDFAFAFGGLPVLLLGTLFRPRIDALLFEHESVHVVNLFGSDSPGVGYVAGWWLVVTSQTRVYAVVEIACSEHLLYNDV